jgi:hypothetical protein
VSRLHDHRRLILVCATVLAALVLAGVAVALAKSQHDARRTLEQRFASGSGTAAALVQTIVDQAYAGDRAVGEQYLSKRRLSAADLARASARTGARGIVVLDAQGRPIAAVPAAARLGAGPGEHRSQALAGRPSISGALRRPRGPVLEVAVPFAADGGVRALVVQTPLAQVQKVLGPYLRRISALSDRRAIIVDHRHGDRLLADSHPGTPLSRDLTDQLSGAPADMSGRFGDGHGYFASSPIAGTPWTLVRTASASSLFDPVDGWQTTVAWVLLGVLVAALALVGRR